MQYKADAAFAAEMDAKDPLAGFRARFHIPKTDAGAEAIYFCGNSLGLQSKAVEATVLEELQSWRARGIGGFYQGKNPWMDYAENLSPALARLVGAKPLEVATMNSLTVNLHMMMVSFYRPTKSRYKIVIEKSAFPSDQYAVKSQISFHGFDPAEALIELAPRAGEDMIRMEDIEDLIAKEGGSIALILIGAVNYYTGQWFDMPRITKAGHAAGAIVGFDLAHAIGNVPMALHDWGVDFACWCTYKYLNSGPAGVAGCFVHERHAADKTLPRFTGWWGNRKETRFKMTPDFEPTPGAQGWMMSNPPVLSMAALKASLDIFEEAGLERLRDKSIKLTGYLEFLLKQIPGVSIFTTEDPTARGCQLSVRISKDGRKVFDALSKAGVICDWREPDCIRLAPVPLYNTFGEAFAVAGIFSEILRG